jgi:hypothetical protein
MTEVSSVGVCQKCQVVVYARSVKWWCMPEVSSGGVCQKCQVVTYAGRSHNLNPDGCLLGCSALMMEAANTFEAMVNFYQTTRRYNPEDSHLHTRRSDNLRSKLTPPWKTSNPAIKGICYEVIINMGIALYH